MSAGANLAVAACLKIRDSGGPPIDRQVICYPPLDFALDSESWRQFDGLFLSREGVAWCHAQYSRDGAVGAYVAPLLAHDFAGLPPALVLGAGFDPLRDDARRYADRLRSDGVEVEYVEYAGAMHAFLSFPGRLSVALEAIEKLGEYLRSSFGVDQGALQHVTSAYAPGADAVLRHFYGGILKLREKPAPSDFAKLGIVWFSAGNDERELHFVPDGLGEASTPHLCIEVENLDAVVSRLAAAGIPVEELPSIAGRIRVAFQDPFDNAIELASPAE